STLYTPLTSGAIRPSELNPHSLEAKRAQRRRALRTARFQPTWAAGNSGVSVDARTGLCYHAITVFRFPVNQRIEERTDSMRASLFTRGKRVCASTKRILQLLGTTAALLLISLPLFSQSNQGVIQGAVFDQTGGAIVGASVTVLDVARGVTRALTTDNAGEYVAPALLPGTYTIRAEAKGFRNVEHSGVLLEVGQTIRVDLTVQPGEQTQTVTVTGELPEIDTTDSTLGGTVSNAAINALPLNGRNFERLLQLRPGVITNPGAGAGNASTNGRRT